MGGKNGLFVVPADDEGHDGAGQVVDERDARRLGVDDGVLAGEG